MEVQHESATLSKKAAKVSLKVKP